MSHCKWNSILESIWFDATWPHFGDGARLCNGDQDGLRESMMADEIGGGIRKLMEGEEAGERRKKCRKALMEGGSSYLSLDRFTEDV